MLALGNDLFGSVVVMVFTSNLLDKVVTALIAWGVVKAMPARTTARFPGVQSVS
jgi:energy-coupling factor transport system substrate-specific component